MKMRLFMYRFLTTVIIIIPFTYLPATSESGCSLLTEPKTIKVSDTLEVKTEDESGRFTWDLAQEQCASYGQGWHVPDILELLILYKKKDTIGGFKGEWYWSSSEFYNDFGRSHNFPTGERNDPYEDKNRPYCVRCVKTIKK